jgi:hypothetical protein
LIEANDDLITSAHNWATQQIRLGNDELNQFSARRQLLGEVALFVQGMPSV